MRKKGFVATGIIAAAGAGLGGLLYLGAGPSEQVKELKEHIAQHENQVDAQQMRDELAEAPADEMEETVLDCYKQLSQETREPDMDVLSVGVGLEDVKKSDVMREMYQANLQLHEDDLHLTVNEEKDLAIRGNMSIDRLLANLGRSFDGFHNLYFVVSSDDFKVGKDYSVISGGSGRMEVVDNDYPQDSLDTFLVEKFRDALEGEKDSVVLTDPEGYEEFGDGRYEDYEQSLIQYGKLLQNAGCREVSIGIYNDDIEPAYLSRVLNEVNTHFRNNYGITLETDFLERELGDSFDLGEEILLLTKELPNHDLYAVLTAHNYDNPTVSGETTGAEGLSSPPLGFMYSEVKENYSEAVRVMKHELYHLFSARHVFVEGSLMHPIVQKGGEDVCISSRNTVFANRERSWPIKDLASEEGFLLDLYFTDAPLNFYQE